MTRFRQIHVRMWKDDWFMELPIRHKLLFIYLVSNERASIAGIYELSLRVIGFETGLTKEEIAQGLVVFEDAGKAFYENNVVWVINLRKYHDTGSDSVRVRIMKDVAAIKDCPLRDRYMKQYGIDSLQGIVEIGRFNVNLGQPSDNGENAPGPPATLSNTKPDRMTAALAYVTGMDPDIRRNRNKLDNTSVQLVNKYEPEFVIKRYGAPDGEWYTSDWRGQRGQAPSLPNIQETIAKDILGTTKTKSDSDDYIQGLEDHLEY